MQQLIYFYNNFKQIKKNYMDKNKKNKHYKKDINIYFILKKVKEMLL